MRTLQDLTQIMADLPLYTDGQEYVVVHLPSAALTAAAGVLAEARAPFGAVLVDKDEVTLILEDGRWEDLKARLPGHESTGPHRLITFDLPLDMGLIGFMAAVSRALAEAGVPILALSAYRRDHLLVPVAQFDTAWAALKALSAV